MMSELDKDLDEGLEKLYDTAFAYGFNAALDVVNDVVCKHFNDDDLLKRIMELKK